MLEGENERELPFRKLVMELVILIAGALFISSLLTPSLFQFLRSIMGEDLWPYSRVFDRVIMVVAVVMLFLRRHHYGVAVYKKSLVGMLSKPRVKPLVVGFFLSFCLSIAALPIVVSGGTLVWSDNSTGVILWRFFKTLPAAAVISIIEEVFFRFFLFLSLRRYLPFALAAVLSSLLYSVVHFIQPVKTWEFTELSVFTGFEYLGLLLDRFTQEGFLPAAFGLFLIGMVLCLTVERSNSLLPALGLHAGWVTTTKVIGKLVESASWFDYPSGSGRRYYLLTHEFTWLTVCLVGLVAFLVFKKKSEKEAD